MHIFRSTCAETGCYLKSQEEAERLYSRLIPAGMTSVIQICDLVMNGPLKHSLKGQYIEWKEVEVETQRNAGLEGQVKVKTPRDKLTTWCEVFMKEFNKSEPESKILQPAFTKVGQNPFTDENSTELKRWLGSLEENALYKSLLACAKSVDL